jgi:hypothetical protein
VSRKVLSESFKYCREAFFHRLEFGMSTTHLVNCCWALAQTRVFPICASFVVIQVPAVIFFIAVILKCSVFSLPIRAQYRTQNPVILEPNTAYLRKVFEEARTHEPCPKLFCFPILAKPICGRYCIYTPVLQLYSVYRCIWFPRLLSF